MKDRRNTDKFNIDLDLTSMLDVIFIILMVVMTSQLLNNAKETATARELSAELEAAKADNKAYEMQLQNMENPEKLVSFVTLYANFESADPKTRHIKLLLGEETAIDDIKLPPDNEETAYKDFGDKLASFLDDHNDTPVLLTLDDSNILYRDHVRMEEILASLKDAHPNLFIRPVGSGE
jgi:biopolymer transport protein ExbD